MMLILHPRRHRQPQGARGPPGPHRHRLHHRWHRCFLPEDPITIDGNDLAT